MSDGMQTLIDESKDCYDKINNEIYIKNKDILLLESTIKSEEFVEKLNKKRDI